MAAPALAGHHAADHLGAVGDGALHMVGRLRAGEALADHPGVAVDEDRHQAAFLPPASTTFAAAWARVCVKVTGRSEEHTSELQSLMRIAYAVFCLKKKQQQ